MQPLQLAGRWIGETQGYNAPAHIWEIAQTGVRLAIRTRWENARAETRLFGQLTPNEYAFSIGHTRAVVIDPLHFVVLAWDTNDTRGGVGPAYDVVFSRPGLPELTAGAAYVRYRAGMA